MRDRQEFDLLGALSFLGIGHRWLARRVGCSCATMAQWVGGDCRPPVEVVAWAKRAVSDRLANPIPIRVSRERYAPPPTVEKP